ncbi:MAG: hypothetical protein LBL45_12760 [Treponema sp.]|jgi:hypothetical protein|nr:hypothetical protein [Treponema sp.]
MKMFYKLVFVALLAATLALAGCDNDLNATVNFPAIKAPDVTATAITDGVKLEWSTDIDAEGYTVFRREGNGEDISIAYSGQNGGIHTDPSTGKYYVRDLQNLSLSSVKAGATYTYTVKAAPVSFHKESAQKEVTVTTGTPFLARGAELDPPTAVAIELLPESNIIKVTVTPGAHGDVADGYWVSINRDGNYLGGAWIDYLQTTGSEYEWPLNQQSSGTYTAWAQTGGNDGFNPFYTASKRISAEEKFESLFGTNFSLNPQVNDTVVGEGANASTAIYYSASIPLNNNLKPGVTYSVERAPANKQRYATGDYAAVTLSKPADNGYTAATPGDLTTDHLGNLKVSLSDRTLPATAGYYVYRVKAVKGDATQYKSKDGYFLSVDPQEIVAQTIRISVGTKDTATAGVTNYAVTPSIYYKNILPSDGKLVIYWVKGDYTSYQSGKYSNKIEFTKAELEAATVTSKTISVPDTATGDLTYYSVYAQAYVEFADGVRNNISTWNGNGVSNTSYYQDPNYNSIRYAQFTY